LRPRYQFLNRGNIPRWRIVFIAGEPGTMAGHPEHERPNMNGMGPNSGDIRVCWAGCDNYGVHRFAADRVAVLAGQVSSGVEDVGSD
jgi:hypothetical protein